MDEGSGDGAAVCVDCGAVVSVWDLLRLGDCGGADGDGAGGGFQVEKSGGVRGG